MSHAGTNIEDMRPTLSVYVSSDIRLEQQEHGRKVFDWTKFHGEKSEIFLTLFWNRHQSSGLILLSTSQPKLSETNDDPQ